jgi:hypothetical protein
VADLEEATACPPAGSRSKKIRVAGVGRDVQSLSHSVMVSSGPTRRIVHINNCVVLVKGNLGGGNLIRNSLVICLGDVGEVASVNGSIILARGHLAPVVMAEGSLFQAREMGAVSSSRGNVFLNVKDVAISFPGADQFVETSAATKLTAPPPRKDRP